MKYLICLCLTFSWSVLADNNPIDMVKCQKYLAKQKKLFVEHGIIDHTKTDYEYLHNIRSGVLTAEEFFELAMANNLTDLIKILNSVQTPLRTKIISLVQSLEHEFYRERWDDTPQIPWLPIFDHNPIAMGTLARLFHKPIESFSRSRYRSSQYQMAWNSGYDAAVYFIKHTDGHTSLIIYGRGESAEPLELSTGTLSVERDFNKIVYTDRRPVRLDFYISTDDYKFQRRLITMQSGKFKIFDEGLVEPNLMSAFSSQFNVDRRGQGIKVLTDVEYTEPFLREQIAYDHFVQALAARARPNLGITFSDELETLNKTILSSEKIVTRASPPLLTHDALANESGNVFHFQPSNISTEKRPVTSATIIPFPSKK